MCIFSMIVRSNRARAMGTRLRSRSNYSSRRIVFFTRATARGRSVSLPFYIR